MSKRWTEDDRARRNAQIIAMREAGKSYTAIAKRFGVCPRTARDVVNSITGNPSHLARISQPSYDALVERWNHLRPHERRERAAECRANGHDYQTAPFSESVTVCRHCLNYVHLTRKAA